MRLPRIVFTNKRQEEILRKHGKIYTVRLNNKKEGRVTIYFKNRRVARGIIRKVTEVHSENLEQYIQLSGFKNIGEWLNHIDNVFLFKGLTPESYSNLALYEVSVMEWLKSGLDGYLEVKKSVRR